MARIAGRRGRVYVAVASGGTPAPLPFVATWTLQESTDKIEVTALEDTTKTYVGGLPDAQGQFAGFYDSATAQTYTAASDGVARGFYLYPDLTQTGTYWWGTVLPDFSIDGDVAGAVKMSASWAAATPIQKVG
jgi:hypothetical protein